MEFVREIIFVTAATAAVLGAALGAAFALRRRSAALRSRILTSAFLLGLALPALLPLLPAPHVRAAAPDSPAAAATAAVEIADATASRTRPAVHTTPRGTDPATPLLLAAVVWFVGCCVTLARLSGAHRRAHALVARARTLADGPAARLLDELDLTGHVRLARSDRTSTPLTVGWRRPVVLLPRDAEGWSEFELEAVLRHELAHVRRRDNAVALVGGLLACLHWFDPVAWWALGRWRREAESACDDAVVRRGVRPSAYARVLLSRARPDATRAVPALAAAPFAAHIRGRLTGLLDARTNRSASPRGAGIAAAAVLLCLVLPLTALRPTVQADPVVLERSPSEAPRAAAPKWWLEMQAEMDEMRAVNRWKRDPSRGTPVPEGTLAGDGWILETHDAVILPGAKYGCVFTSDGGYARVAYADGGEFGLSAFTHPPLSKLERTLDKLLVPLDLDTGGEPRAYRIEGRSNAPYLERFRGVLNAAAANLARSESP